MEANPCPFDKIATLYWTILSTEKVSIFSEKKKWETKFHSQTILTEFTSGQPDWIIQKQDLLETFLEKMMNNQALFKEEFKVNFHCRKAFLCFNLK